MRQTSESTAGNVHKISSEQEAHRTPNKRRRSTDAKKEKREFPRLNEVGLSIEYPDLPPDLLSSIAELLKKNSTFDWQNTPALIKRALTTLGFSVIVTKKGSETERGDAIRLKYRDMLFADASTVEICEFLQAVSIRQYLRMSSESSKKDTEDFSVIKTADTSRDTKEYVMLDRTPDATYQPQNRFSNTDIVDADVVSFTPRGNTTHKNLTEDGDDDLLRTRAQEAHELRLQELREEEETQNNSIEGGEGVQEAQNVPPEPPPDMQKPEYVFNHQLSQEYTIDPEIEVNGYRVNAEQYGTFHPHTKREQAPVSEVKKEATLGTEKVSAGEKNERTKQSPRKEFFDPRFAEYGISKENWESIEGHEMLSQAQQKLVFENLRELSSRDTPFMKGIWEGIKAKLGRTKESEDHLTTLTQLVHGVALYGPKVHEDEETGELFPDFVDINRPPRDERKDYITAIDALNRQAHMLAKTPASWLEDGIGTHSERESRAMSFIKEHLSPARKKYNEYQRILNSYEASKKALAQVLGGSGYSPSEIAQKLVEIDGKVYGLQFQQTSPEAVEEIKRIPDPHMWKTVGTSLKSASFYMGLGYVGRTALAGALGIFAAPAVGAVIAGGRSWNRSAAELRERDRGARSGVRDTSQEALNIVSAEMTMNIGGEKREVGVTQKLQKLLDEYQELNMKEDSMNPQNFEKAKNTILNHMRARVSYVEDKQRLNRISYGNKEEHAVQMATLYETLALAKIILADQYNVEEKSELERRLSMVLFFREQSIQKRRRSLQTKKVAWNAFKAGACAYAGGELAEKVREWDLGTKLDSLVKDRSVDRVSVEGGLSIDNKDVSATSTPDTSTPSVAESVSKTPEIQETPPYTIKSGDTLSSILKEQIPEIKNLGAGKAQENAIANILRGLSSEELKGIGIKSGDISLIRAGDTIDLDVLEDSIKSQQGVIDSAIARFGDADSQIQRGGEILKSDAFIPNQYGEGPYDSTSDILGSSQSEVISGAQQEVLNTGSERYVDVKAKMLETHFQKEIFGNEWNKVKGMTVDEYSAKTSVLRFGGASKESTKVIKELMATVAKPPMNVSHVRGETMQTYLGRAYTAFAKHENVIPQGNTIRKILREARMSKMGE